MSRYLLSLMLLLVVVSASIACDVCGCGAGNYYFGMMPQFHKNFVGIRYRQFSYRSHLGQHAIHATQETFHVSELWGRYYPHSRVQLLGFLPWAYHEQHTYQGTKTLQGIADAMILANYQLIQIEKENHKHSLWAGMGVKMPTGKSHYDTNDATHVANPNFQLGTGSWDLLFNTFYQFRRQKWGINADAAFKMNTANSQEYRFGNRVSGNLAFFHVQKVKNVGLMPHLGIYAEHSFMDTQKGILLENTGGNLLAQTLGVEFFYKNINIGANAHVPLAQDLASGSVKANNRGLLHITWVF